MKTKGQLTLSSIMVGTLLFAGMPAAADSPTPDATMIYDYDTNTPPVENVTSLQPEGPADAGYYMPFTAASEQEKYDSVVKFTPSDTFQWSRAFDPNSKTADLAAMAVDSQGNIYAVGTSIAAPNTDQDCRIVKFNSQGQYVWQKMFNNTVSSVRTDQRCNAIVIGTDNSVYVGGKTYYPGTSDPSYLSLLLKFSPAYNPTTPVDGLEDNLMATYFNAGTTMKSDIKSLAVDGNDVYTVSQMGGANGSPSEKNYVFKFDKTQKEWDDTKPLCDPINMPTIVPPDCRPTPPPYIEFNNDKSGIKQQSFSLMYDATNLLTPKIAVNANYIYLAGHIDVQATNTVNGEVHTFTVHQNKIFILKKDKSTYCKYNFDPDFTTSSISSNYADYNSVTVDSSGNALLTGYNDYPFTLKITPPPVKSTYCTVAWLDADNKPAPIWHKADGVNFDSASSMNIDPTPNNSNKIYVRGTTPVTVNGTTIMKPAIVRYNQ